MPITPPIPILNQVLPNPGVVPYVQQQNFAQMVGNVLTWNPSFDVETIKVQLNSHIRKIYDRRTWFGLMVRGQIQTIGFTIGGTCVLTQGSKTVQGVNTAWTPAIINQQFRQGYNTPIYNITALDQTAQVLTLELPWAFPSQTNGSYFIAQYYYNLGPNIKYVHTAKNLFQAWRLRLDLNQQSLDAIDPWRINTFMPRALAQMPVNANGSYMVELWPVPSIVMGLPFIAAIQPPNLIADTDSLPPYIRTDILVKYVIADALVWRGPKQNPYYDAQESQRLRGEAESELLALAAADENLYRVNLQYEFESMRMADIPGLDAGGGSIYAINHGVYAGPGTGEAW